MDGNNNNYYFNVQEIVTLQGILYQVALSPYIKQMEVQVQRNVIIYRTKNTVLTYCYV